MLTDFICNIVVLNSEIHMIDSSWISVLACEYVCVGNERKKEGGWEETSG